MVGVGAWGVGGLGGWGVGGLGGWGVGGRWGRRGMLLIFNLRINIFIYIYINRMGIVVYQGPLCSRYIIMLVVISRASAIQQLSGLETGE